MGLLSSGLLNKSIKVLALRVFGVMLFFSLTLFLTNFYNPELVGKYDFSKSFLLLLGTISVLGMNQSIIFYSGYLKSIHSIQELKGIYFKMISIIFFISIFLLVGTFFISGEILNNFFNKNIDVLIKKTILCVFFYSITMLNIETFRAINKIIVSEVIRNIFRYIFFVIAILILFKTNREDFLVDAFLLNFVIVGIFSSLFLFVMFYKEGLRDTKTKIKHKDIVKKSAPMAISLVSLMFMQSIDIILLSKFSDFKSVASYGVAVKLTIIITLALTSVNAVFAPKIAELYNLKLFSILKKEVNQATRLIALLTIPVILGIVVFSNFFLGLFGTEYLISKKALLILLVGQTINALCGSVGVYMNMTNKQNVLQLFLIIAFIINLVLNLALIPMYGINGAALSTTISMVFWNVLGAYYIYKVDKVKTFLN